MHLNRYRLNKKKFKVFLGKHYNYRIVDKVAALFEFVNPQDYMGFYKQVEELFMKGGNME